MKSPRQNVRSVVGRFLALAAALLLAPTGASAGLVNLISSRDFQSAGNITGDASTQLTGLASLAAFEATNPANRYVYSFLPWPQASTAFGTNSYAFQFDLNGNGVANQTITLSTTNPWPSYKLAESFPGNIASSSPTALTGFGDIGWSGSLSAQTYTFSSPVSAVGMVFRSGTTFLLKKDNGYPLTPGYPVSYTLTDGTVVNLGTSGVTGATIPASTNTWVGVVDSTGKGITSITININGTSTSGQVDLTVDDLAFVMKTAPPPSAVINLSASNDFAAPGNITANASAQLPGLSSLSDLRSIPLVNRFVYSFESWPLSTASLGSNTYTFLLDLNGDGETDENVTVMETSPSNQPLTQVNLGSSASSPNNVLGGLGDIGEGGSGYATHTFTFSNPVSSVGMVYRSPGNFNLANSNGYPVSYTLTDGTVVNLGAQRVSGATISANTNTYVGVTDSTGKGITSFTVSLRGSSSGSQAAYVDDLAFVLANNPPIPGQGPPSGNWTMTFDDEFNGTALNGNVWSTGMRWSNVINNELEGYVPANVSVANSMCSFKTELRTVQNTSMTGYQGQTQSYASGCIETYTKWSQLYGYFEARMKMPGGGGGTWPAFWLLPDRGVNSATLDQRVAVGNTIDGVSIPMSNEIDILEYVSCWKNATTGFGAAHEGYFWSYASGGSFGNYAELNQGAGGKLPVLNQDTQWHTYGILWEPGVLQYYVDGQVVLNNSSPTNVSVVPEYMILNCALSTNGWIETLTTAQINAGLPASTQIDYVRAYSLAPPPVLTSSNLSASVAPGAAFSYQIPATGTVSSYSATGLPPGFTLNPSTGLITGSSTAVGSYPITVTVTNAAGAVTASLTLTVGSPVASTDTPTMPVWGLALLGVLLYLVATRRGPFNFDGTARAT